MYNIIELYTIEMWEAYANRVLRTPANRGEREWRLYDQSCISRSDMQDSVFSLTLVFLKGIYTPAGSLTFSNSGLPDHHSPTL